jgi:hypothetical protein
MYDPKTSAPVDTAHDQPDEERIAGQADDLDRGTGLASSGGGLDKAALDDLKKSGTDPDFDKSLSETKGKTP